MNDIEFISAGAGTGKTYRLTEILAQALETGAARPHAVLATTFTVKAASELRERTRARLLRSGRLDLATAIGQARLGTVNSVCGQLLKRFCFELGLSPEQTVLSEAQAKRLLKSSLAETLDGSGQAELVRLTSRFGIDHAEWASSISKVVQAARDNDIAPPALRAMGTRNADAMLAHWPAPATGTGTELTSRLATEIASAEQTVRTSLESLEASGGKVTGVLRDGLNDLQRLDRAFRADRWTWLDWVAASTVKAGASMRGVLEPVVSAAQAHERHPLFHAEVRRYLDVIFNLAADALDTYARAKAMLGAVDFSDQEVFLLQAIREEPAVRDVLAAELDLVMVDEFQDTSPLQLALFVELAKLASRSVWVGDPKQAIYGFRGTDSRLITQVLAAIEGWGGKLGKPLNASRRSTPALVSLTNTVFEPTFAPGLASEQVLLNPVRKDIPGQPSLFNWNFESSRKETHYLGLGAALHELLASGMQIEDKATGQLRSIRPGDVGVLCRKNDQVDLAVASLTKWGIPCASPRAGLLSTPEVILVLACLRRLLDARDTVATALVLTLADSMSVDEWLADRLNHISSEKAKPHTWRVIGESAHPLLARLETLRPQLLGLTPHEALQLAKAESQVARVASQWSNSPHEARTRIANVERLLEFGKSYEDECEAEKRPANVGGLLHWLEALARDGSDERAVAVDDAVAVMTYHGAKGLEWPVVAMTAIDAASRTALWDVQARTEGVFDAQRPLDNRVIHFWPKTWGNRTQPQAALEAQSSSLGKTFAADALSESKRLFYVGLTRARDAVVLASCTKREKPDRSWVEEVGACDVLFGDSKELTLPDGQALLRQTKSWSADECSAEPPQLEGESCHWFRCTPPRESTPLWFRPSASRGGTHVISEIEQIGTRVDIKGKVDMTTLGTAVHLCIARAGALRKAQLSDVERILSNWRLNHAIDKLALRNQIEAFLAWVSKRWPACRVSVEVPIETGRPDGTRLRGRADFAVGTPDGWILFDHKANPQGAAHDEALVTERGPQLTEYAHAIAHVTGRPVKEKWLYLPISGRALRVEAVV